MTRPLRAGINAIFLEPGMGGLETYVLQLIPELVAAEPRLELTVLCNAKGRALLEAQAWASELRLTTPAGSRRGLRALYELGPLGARAGRSFDVLHSPALTAPLATRVANVVVLADTTWITHPSRGRGQSATMRLWQSVVPHVARRADRIVAISDASALDVESHLRVPRDRIDTIPLGYSPALAQEATPEPELRERLRLGEGALLLSVGALKPHKNQLRLVQALPRIRAAVPGTRLVMSGAITPYADEVVAEAERLGVDDAVTMTGYSDARDVEGLYRAAAVFLMPSLNEGFGLPVLEAMGRGVPVVASDRSALPEVAGDAALLVDPESVDAIADAATRVLGDAALRERLIAGGHERPAVFTWRRTALETLDSWARALAGRR